MAAIYHNNADFHVIPADGQTIQNLTDSGPLGKITVADLKPALPQEGKKFDRYLHDKNTPSSDPEILEQSSSKNK